MRIKKTSETRALAGNIVNAYSESQNSAYASDYANKAFGGKVLWTNESPSSSFAGQAVPFSSTDIDVVDIYYTRFQGSKLFCVRVPYKNNNQSEIVYSDYDNGVRSWNRNITMTTTGITFGDCKINGTTTNTGLIPYKIIGYKTGLFN